MKKSYYKSEEKYPYLSVLILNHNRPHNLEKSIPILCSYPFISEILIFHGNKENYRNFESVNHVIVKNMVDYINNDIYGSARRFFHFSKCKQDLILFLDDDIIPSKTFLTEALLYFRTKPYPNNIAGSIERSCDSSGYNNKKNADKNSVIVLACVVIPKKVMENYMKLAFPVFESWIKKYRGNCEDITINLFVKNYYNNIPIIIKEPVQELDISNGYSSQKDHYDIRDAFCKSFHNVTFPVQSLPESNESFFKMFISFYKQHESIFHDDIKPPLLDGFVDQIYCICLESRKEYMIRTLKENHLFSHTMFVKPICISDITREEYNIFSDILVDPDCMIYYKLSKLPVHLSYLMVMYHSMIYQFRHIIILEDDIHFNRSLIDINHYIKTYHSIMSTGSVLYLGYCGLNCDSVNIKKTETPLLYRLDSFEDIYCKHAILHNTLYFPLFFKSHKKCTSFSDYIFNDFYKEYSIPRFITNTSLIDQDTNLFGSENDNYYNILMTCTL